MSDGGLRILLVEDDLNDALLAERALSSCKPPPRLEIARDGQEALVCLGLDPPDGAPGDVTLVLLDLKLPKVSGLEVLRRIRADARTCTLRVVMLTSSAAEGDRREAFRLGANSFVRKPMDYVTFTETLRTIVHYWSSVDAGPPGLG
ncbi:MAG: response regulator [Myxococcota bacterium]